MKTFETSSVSPPSPLGSADAPAAGAPAAVPTTAEKGLSVPMRAALGAVTGLGVGALTPRKAPLWQYALGGAIIVPTLGAVYWWFTADKTQAKQNPLIPGFGASPMPCLGVGAPPSAELSYLQNSIGGVQEKGFGPKTQAAVVAFQKSKGIYADGIAGPQTWASLGLPGQPCGGGTVQIGPPPPGSGGLQTVATATGAKTETGKTNWWFYAALGLAGVVIWQNRKEIRRRLKGKKEKAPKRATVPIIPAAWSSKEEPPEPEEDLSFFEEDFEPEPAPEPEAPEIAAGPAPLMLTQRPEDDFIEAEWEDVEPVALPAPEEPAALPVREPAALLAAKNRRPRRKTKKRRKKK